MPPNNAERMTKTIQILIRLLHQEQSDLGILYLLGPICPNKNIIMCSFKSSGDIQKKEGGPDSCFG